MEGAKHKISTRTRRESKKKISQYRSNEKESHDSFARREIKQKGCIKDLEQDDQTRVSTSTSNFVLNSTISSRLYNRRKDKHTSDSQRDDYNLNFLHEYYTETLDSLQQEVMITERGLKRNIKEIKAVFDNPDLKSDREKFQSLKRVYKKNMKTPLGNNPFDEEAFINSALPRHTLEDSSASSVESLSYILENTKL